LAWGQFFNGSALVVSTICFLAYRLRQAGVPLTTSLSRIRELFGLLCFTFLSRSIAVIGANLDLVIVTRILGTEMAAVLALTRRVPESLRPLVDRPTYAFLPAITHLYAAGEIEKTRQVLLRLSRIVFWLLGLFTVGFLVLNDDFIALWVGPEFYAGHTVNFLICMGIFLAIIIASLNGLCFSMGAIKQTSFLGALQGGLTIVLLYLGGKHFGMIGLVAAPVIAMAAVGAWYLPRLFCRQLSLHSSDQTAMLTEVARVVLSCSVTGVLFWFVQAESWTVFIISVLSLIAVYTSLMLLLSPAMREECRAPVLRVHARLWSK